MFSHGYFESNYFSPNYWPPIEQGVPPGGGGGPEKGEEGRAPQSLPSIFEIREILRRIREDREKVLTEEEDAILLLLLSDVFGSIGGNPLQSKVIKDADDDLLLLLLGSQWPS